MQLLRLVFQRNATCDLAIIATGERHISEQDRVFMAQALELARRGLGKTAPNPAVGCVIVKDGKVRSSAEASRFVFKQK